MAFIVNTASSLRPDPSDTTHALLMILINEVDNATFSDASLPVWDGPNISHLWIQSLAYTSLSLSICVAFGAMLGKQWLGHYKTSRFGRGALHERCKRRQRKLDGMESYGFRKAIALLPNFLQTSAAFFAIALVLNLWTQQPDIALIIIVIFGTTGIAYVYTLVDSLRSPHCPFKSPLFHSPANYPANYPANRIRFPDVRRMVREKGSERPQSWAGVLNWMLVFMEDTSRIVWVVTGHVSRALAYISRIPSTLMGRARSQANHPESAGSWELSESSQLLDLSCLDLPASDAPVEAMAIRWIIETCTDTDIMTAAVMMVPEVEWPDEHGAAIVSERLKNHFYACFDPTLHLNPLTKQRAEACLKAISHVTRATGPSIHFKHHGVCVDDRWYNIPRDQGFLLVSRALGVSNELDITSLPPSERMWLAYMFTHSLQEGMGDIQFLNSIAQFIQKCLHDPRTPAPRLVADCLLLSGLMIGLRPEGRYLAKIDKREGHSLCITVSLASRLSSTAIPGLQHAVTARLLDLLLNRPSVPPQLESFQRNARQLLWPLAHPLERHVGTKTDHQESIQWLKLCFQFLADERQAEGAEVRFNDIGATLRHSLLSSPNRENNLIWMFLHEAGPTEELCWMDRPNLHTPAQFDLMVDYLLRVCEGTNYDIIGDTFVTLASLRGSPSTLERKRLYIGAAVRCMDQEIPIYARHAAMSAASSVRTEIALLGRDDQLFRELCSHALTSAYLTRDLGIPEYARARLDNAVFYEQSLYSLHQDLCYLKLLCAFAQEPAWHDVLDRDGHIKRCLTIADKLSSWKGVSNLYAVHIAQIFAVLDALGENANRQLLSAIEAYPTWPLVVRSWGYIFDFSFFKSVTAEGWKELSGSGTLEVLPSLLAYAMRHWRQWDNRAETYRLLQLVTQVCDKLVEQQHKREGDVNSLKHRQLEDDSSDNQVISGLGRDIQSLLQTWKVGHDAVRNSRKLLED